VHLEGCRVIDRLQTLGVLQRATTLLARERLRVDPTAAAHDPRQARGALGVVSESIG
jgi:hypothetical protein